MALAMGGVLATPAAAAPADASTFHRSVGDSLLQQLAPVVP